MSPIGADLVATGACCAVGLGIEQTAAAVRARVDAFRESPIQNSRSEPMVMALVPDSALPPLPAELAALGLPVRTARLLRLGAVALRECAERLPDGVTLDGTALLLAAPEGHPSVPTALGDDFLARLAAASGVGFDVDASRLWTGGRAAAFEALADALARLESGELEQVLVGGLDSFLDLMLLWQLDSERRVQAADILDGFIPGEGAAFVLLTNPGRGPALARLTGCATGAEAGHRYSDDPYRGEGLAAVFADLLGQAHRLSGPVRSIWAGFNGESFPAKEYSVACLRSTAELAAERAIEHPADCFGDAGAALVPLMLAIAAEQCVRGELATPCLFWASSDGPLRGAALMDAATPTT